MALNMIKEQVINKIEETLISLKMINLLKNTVERRVSVLLIEVSAKKKCRNVMKY